MNANTDSQSNIALDTFSVSPEFLETTNLAWLMQRVGFDSYDELHNWSVQNRESFWQVAIERIGIRFQRPFSRVLDLPSGVETPCWLPDARLNIADSCFQCSPASPAIVYQAEGGPIQTMTYGQLEVLTNRVAASLIRQGFTPGDAIAVIMPMTAESVAIYLGIVKAGCVVVGIADSFRPQEIATRLKIANAAGVFTQDFSVRAGKRIPIYSVVVQANAPRAILLSAVGEAGSLLRPGDCLWSDFLDEDESFESCSRRPSDHLNILFSSGTTGEPKAIPWNHTTPIKSAVDAHFHHDIRPGDVLVWPTNLGWMMGPWLIFASLMNRATIGLFDGAPHSREFGQFVHASHATMLGVIPTLVKTWRRTSCMNGLDWNSIKLLSSTGEVSSADDMLWLMNLAGGKPVIEYCGGTEIGGGYITNTLARPCVPGTFNTATLGLDFVILDDDGRPALGGELFLLPPSIGLATQLLNKDHHDVYFADTPPGPASELLRRHGDCMERSSQNRWRALGRADDTMNLGGIKVSSIEIEQVLRRAHGVDDIAAVAISSGDGPSLLVIFVVASPEMQPDKRVMVELMQDAIRRDLNPLFKIHDLVFIDALPRTASNKIVRRTLRDQYSCKA